MMGRTHLLGGLAAGAGLALEYHLHLPMAAGIAGIAGLSALLPDIDQPQSMVAGLVPGGKIVGRVGNAAGVHHRGPTHSLLLAGAFTGLFWLLVRHAWPIYYVAAFAVGYLSHLALDWLNKRGQPWLWPLPKRFQSPVGMAADGLVANLLVMPGLLALAVWLLWLILR
jgi:inner membrane protein